MHPSLKHLIALQSVDQRAAELRQQLSSFPARFAELERQLAAARKLLDDSRTALTKSLTDRKTLELDVEQWKQRIRKYKDQTAEVKSNEAYRALQHEIAQAEIELAHAEDRLLERMVAAEELEQQLRKAERALREAEAVVAAERSKLEAEQVKLERELAALADERERVLQVLPTDLLNLYQRIARKHGGVALAEVREETCSVCRVRIRPQVYQELRRPDNDQIFHCESCTRILYCAEHDAAGVAHSSTP
jgi:predicted  nucleic acid-binding Zn-ribbon protein